MKKYMLLLVGVAANLHGASGFKSTQDALNAISNKFNSVLHAPNIYDKKISLNGLVDLGDQLNAHIMGKQGVILGTISKRKGIGGHKSGVYGNIFDLWDTDVFYIFTQIITAIKTVRLAGSAQNDAGQLLRNLSATNALPGMKDHALAIRKDAILADKKKIADIIIFFMENVIELVNKAVTNFNYL